MTRVFFFNMNNNKKKIRGNWKQLKFENKEKRKQKYG